jgi:Uma2 family endonuclease
MPELDLDAPLTVRPDWACEVLSPGNTRTVIVKKQAAYARAGVEWLWLVNPDPVVRTLQVFRLDAGSGLWLLDSTFSDEATARVPPFDIDVAVDKLWF